MAKSIKFLSLAASSLLLLTIPEPIIATPIPRNFTSQNEAVPLSTKSSNLLNYQELPKTPSEERLKNYPINYLGENNLLRNGVNSYSLASDSNQAIKVSKTNLEKAIKNGDRNLELKYLIELGETYNFLGEYQQAIQSATASLSLAQKLDNAQGKVSAYVMLASAYQFLASSKSDYQQATSAAMSGLTAAWDIKDYQSEAKALTILASANNLLNKNREAVVFAQQGLKIAERNNLPTFAASSLLTLASIQIEEANYTKTIESTQKSLNYLQKLPDQDTSAIVILQGLAYYGQGSTQESTELAEQGVIAAQKVKQPLIEALGLIVLSLNAKDQKDYPKALLLINQSRTIAKSQNNTNLEGFILELRASIYKKSGDKQQAIADYQEAIALNNSYTAKAGLARIYQDENLLATAITYYKQAINTKETQPQLSISGLPDWLQDSFSKAVQDLNELGAVNIYRSLTNLLLLQRRIPEAQQVLEMLKTQELREYTGTEINNQPINLTLNNTEKQILKEYGSLITFGQKLEQCQQKNCQELTQLLEQRDLLTKSYEHNIEQLEIALGTRLSSDPAFLNPTQFALKAQAITEEQPDTVLIYPLILQDKIWLLWASKGGIFKSVEVTGVSESQLEVTVLRFRQLVQNRLSDLDELKATGKQLYDWLIKPVESELQANNIKNLVFSLDRSTRYIPMSALYDGEKFLVENYRISTVLAANLTKTQTPLSSIASAITTPAFACGEGCRLTNRNPEDRSATIQRLLAVAKIAPKPHQPRILGLGVSEAVAGYEALPNVPAELDAIVQQEVSDAKGVYPGQKFLNKAFDFFSLRDNLADRQILHIATHAEFVPGRAYKSFLLLGTGEKLAIPDIEKWLNLRDVNLVVLSACETALGGAGLDGREISGLAYYFLNGGAKTVMASLWRIDDLSTRLLMEQFYENLAKGTITSPVTKAEALRQAQLALLKGKPNQESSMPSVKKVEIPLINNKSYFSHPYYWASFVLMGSGGAN